MQQVNSVRFINDDQKIVITCDNSTPLGDFHDFLLSIKGWTIDKMIKAQKEEEENLKTQQEAGEKPDSNCDEQVAKELETATA